MRLEEKYSFHDNRLSKEMKANENLLIFCFHGNLTEEPFRKRRSHFFEPSIHSSSCENTTDMVDSRMNSVCFRMSGRILPSGFVGASS